MTPARHDDTLQDTAPECEHDTPLEQDLLEAAARVRELWALASVKMPEVMA